MSSNVSKKPLPDLVWRVQMSNAVLELTREVKALTEVVIAMNEKLAATEEQS
jgi:hypothetical protein